MLNHVRKYDRVEIKTGSQGVIRYIGNVEFAESKDEIWYGIQLDQKYFNGHNGMVEDVAYFWCPEGQGTFVKPRDIIIRFVPIPNGESKRVIIDHDDVSVANLQLDRPKKRKVIKPTNANTRKAWKPHRHQRKLSKSRSDERRLQKDYAFDDEIVDLRRYASPRSTSSSMGYDEGSRRDDKARKSKRVLKRAMKKERLAKPGSRVRSVSTEPKNRNSRRPNKHHWNNSIYSEAWMHKPNRSRDRQRVEEQLDHFTGKNGLLKAEPRASSQAPIFPGIDDEKRATKPWQFIAGLNHVSEQKIDNSEEIAALKKEIEEQKLEEFRLRNRLEQLETDSSTAADPDRIQVVELEKKVWNLEERLNNNDSEKDISDQVIAKKKMEDQLAMSKRETDKLKLQLENARRTEAEELQKVSRLSDEYLSEFRKCTEAMNTVELKKVEINHLKSEIENSKADLKKMETDFAKKMEVKNEEIRQTQAKLKEKREQVKTICDELDKVRKVVKETSIRADEAKQKALSKEKEIIQKKEEMKQKEIDRRKMIEETTERDKKLQDQLEEFLTKTEENRPSKVKKKITYARRLKRPTRRKQQHLKSWGNVRPLSEVNLSKKDLERSEAEARVLAEMVRPEGKRPTEASVLKDEVILVVKLGSKASDEGIACCFKTIWPLTKVVRAGLAVWQDRIRNKKGRGRLAEKHKWITRIDVSKEAVEGIRQQVKLRILLGGARNEYRGGQLDGNLRKIPQLKHNTRIILTRLAADGSESRLVTQSMPDVVAAIS